MNVGVFTALDVAAGHLSLRSAKLMSLKGYDRRQRGGSGAGSRVRVCAQSPSNASQCKTVCRVPRGTFSGSGLCALSQYTRTKPHTDMNPKQMSKAVELLKPQHTGLKASLCSYAPAGHFSLQDVATHLFCYAERAPRYNCLNSRPKIPSDVRLKSSSRLLSNP